MKNTLPTRPRGYLANYGIKESEVKQQREDDIMKADGSSSVIAKAGCVHCERT